MHRTFMFVFFCFYCKPKSRYFIVMCIIEAPICWARTLYTAIALLYFGAMVETYVNAERRGRRDSDTYNNDVGARTFIAVAVIAAVVILIHNK